MELPDSLLHVGAHLEGLDELLPEVFLVDRQPVASLARVFAQRQSGRGQHFGHQAGLGALDATGAAGGGDGLGLVAGKHSLPHFSLKLFSLPENVQNKIVNRRIFGGNF